MNYDLAIEVLVENLYNSANDVSKEMIYEAMKFLVEKTDCPNTKKTYIEGDDFTFFEPDLNVVHKKVAMDAAREAFEKAERRFNSCLNIGIDI